MGRSGPLDSSKPKTKQFIPENEQQDNSLEESELRYRRLFESALDGILILDAETGEITDVNPYLIDLLG